MIEPVENRTLQSLSRKFGASLIESGQDRGDLVAVVERGSLHEIVAFLRDDRELDFNMLIDLCGVDYLPRKPRFEVVYQVHSLERNERLRLKTPVPEDDCRAPTISDLYPVADWLERECWDMFGIVFEGHPNLKRLLMYDSFIGHPLRKDYPINRRQPLIGPNN
jgi:NADH-quinone oxidoreductase subunit C